jgi:hypothetical protein
VRGNAGEQKQKAGDESENEIQFWHGLVLVCAIVTSPGESCNESDGDKDFAYHGAGGDKNGLNARPHPGFNSCDGE